MQPGDAPPGNGDDDAAGALADVPAEHRAGRGDPAPPAVSPMFVAPAGAATGMDPAAGAAASRPAAATMTDADTPAALPPSPPPDGVPTAGLPVSGRGGAATPLAPARLPAPAVVPAGARGDDTTTAAAGAKPPGGARNGVPLAGSAHARMWDELARRNELARHLASASSAGPAVARESDATTAGAGTTTPGEPRSGVVPPGAGLVPTAAAPTAGAPSPPAHRLNGSAAPERADRDPPGELRSDTAVGIAALLVPSWGEKPRSGTCPGWLGE